MIRPRRSVLFMPGSNARALEKARALDCDVVALDLEDAVAPEDKALARIRVCEAVAAKAFGGKEVAVRINPLSSPFGHADMLAVAKAHPDAVILPKVSGPAEVGAEHRAFPESIAIWAMIETPKAMLHLDAIAGAGAACLVLGANDLLKEMGARPMAGRDNLLAAMSLTVIAARAHGLAAIDATYNAIADSDGFARSCEQGRSFGFDGKTLIHPSQIEIANRVFSPSAAELDEARRILAAFAQHPEKSVFSFEGRMVERLHAEEAARLLALADAIGKRC
ncbi:MAG TPA: CoA ester lyase [Rhizomicrobium sp.]|nr:CoA ester lyase [Rhizomicrobium sp.]